MPENTNTSIPGQYAGPVIGVVFIVGTFALLSMVLLGHTKIEWKDIALVIVGSLLNQCSVILGKWFTASQSSDNKTTIMADAAKTAIVASTETAKVLAAAEVKAKIIDPLGEAHEYKEQTAVTLDKAEMAAENAKENVEDLKK